MKNSSKYILFITACLLSQILFACMDDGDEENYINENKGMVYLRIQKLESNSAFLADKVEERIKSLRFIMLSDNNIEINELIPGNKLFPDVSDNSLLYYFIYPASEGKKRFYLIANEESVNSIQYQPLDNTPLPEGIEQNISLSALLNNELFKGKESSENEQSGHAVEFENVLKAIYFEPVYNIETDSDESKYIYLPYSVYYGDNYEIIKDDKTGALNKIEATFYLVPIATKFEFHFENYRKSEVTLSNLQISNFDNLNFLLARVGNKDLSKTYKGEKYYWVDWLNKIAKDSYSPDFNGAEWIKEYSIPSPSTQYVQNFPKDIEPEKLTIPGLKEIDGTKTPGILEFGPYYMPESYNLMTYTSDGKETNELQFGIKFTLTDESVKDFTKKTFYFDTNYDGTGGPVAISNLGSLFRDTHVVIKVEMSEGEPIIDGIYGEIVPWIKRNGWGYTGSYKK